MLLKKLVIVGLAASMLAGCTTGPNQNATLGTLAGAVGGAALGSAFGQGSGHEHVHGRAYGGNGKMEGAALQAPFGKLADKTDKVRLLVGGCLCMSLAIFLIPLMTNFAAMLAVYLFLGFGEAILWPVLGAYAAEEGREQFGHGTMMGAFNLAMSAGVFTGAMLAGVSMDALGMRQAYHATAAAVLILPLAAAMLIRTGEVAGEGGALKSTSSSTF